MKHILRDKSFQFSLDVIDLTRKVMHAKREYVLTKQLIKSGTSIGANLREARDAQSASDFVHKNSIALKEARETEYWIELLRESHLISTKDAKHLLDQNNEIIAMLVACIKTSKKKITTSHF